MSCGHDCFRDFFPRYEFGTGVHWVGEMGHGSKYRLLMDYICDWQLDWAPMDDVLDAIYIVDNKTSNPSTIERHEFHKGADQWKDHLKRTFPKEHKGIDKWVVEILVIIYKFFFSGISS